jgi:SAM-dependent methyltransferase
MRESYDHYYRTRHYDERYPGPNRRTLAYIRSAARRGGVLVDVGAGNGRYAIPLARSGFTVVAVERSDIARDQLLTAARAHNVSDGIICFKDVADVAPELLARCELGLFLFGVLGHMDFSERRRVIGYLRSTMRRPARIIGSVPNRHRRFRQEQADSLVADGGPAPRFRYRRPFGGLVNEFEYTAFTPEELISELNESGTWEVTVKSESLLPENVVTRRRGTGVFDGLVARAMPAGLGYGILFDARSVRALK